MLNKKIGTLQTLAQLLAARMILIGNKHKHKHKYKQTNEQVNQAHEGLHNARTRQIAHDDDKDQDCTCQELYEIARGGFQVPTKLHTQMKKHWICSHTGFALTLDLLSYLICSHNRICSHTGFALAPDLLSHWICSHN